MTDASDKPILVIGASGLVGRRLVQMLLADRRTVRCFSRNPKRAADLTTAGCEVTQGDIVDPAALRDAIRGAGAVYVTIHTLSPQPGSAAGIGFMDIEARGISNIIDCARSEGVARVIYITSLGIEPDAHSEWLRGRWWTEEHLLTSGLAATVIRPGHIVGVGGHGFDTVVQQARRRVAVMLAGDRPLSRTIALDDLVYYLTGILENPASFGQRFDVGSNDILSVKQMIDIVSDHLGRQHPIKLTLPRPVLRLIAPLVGRLAGLPKGALAGLLDALLVDSIGDPRPIRNLLPRVPISFREAVEQVLAG